MTSSSAGGSSESFISDPFRGEFVDLGSGTGKVLAAAALLGNFNRCVGLELVPSLHREAELLLGRQKATEPEIGEEDIEDVDEDEDEDEKRAAAKEEDDVGGGGAGGAGGGASVWSSAVRPLLHPSRAGATEMVALCGDLTAVDWTNPTETGWVSPAPPPLAPLAPRPGPEPGPGPGPGSGPAARESAGEEARAAAAAAAPAASAVPVPVPVPRVSFVYACSTMFTPDLMASIAARAAAGLAPGAVIVTLTKPLFPLPRKKTKKKKMVVVEAKGEGAANKGVPAEEDEVEIEEEEDEDDDDDDDDDEEELSAARAALRLEADTQLRMSWGTARVFIYTRV